MPPLVETVARGSGTVAALRVLVLLAVCAPLVCDSQALSWPDTHAAPRLDVVSIKPVPADRSCQFVPLQTLPGGRLRTPCITADMVVLMAYQLNRNDVAGASDDWISVETYSIEATTDSADKIGPGDRNALARALLAERFHFKAHHEAKPGLFFSLVAANGGPRLKPADGAAKPGVFAQPRPETDPERPGQWRIVSYKVVGVNTTIGAFAEVLSALREKPVEDHTDIQGRYDFSFEVGQDDPGSPTLPLLNSALQDNLGLRLELRRGPVQRLVVDYIERPTPN